MSNFSCLKSEKICKFYVHLKLYLGNMLKVLKRRFLHFDVKKEKKIKILDTKETWLEVVGFCTLGIDKLSFKLIQGFFKHVQQCYLNLYRFFFFKNLVTIDESDFFRGTLAEVLMNFLDQ